MILVAGFCLMGCAVVCCARGCPRPFAASELLADPETEHVVDYQAGGLWTMKHPLRERLDDQLMRCQLVQYLGSTYPGPGAGRYRVRDSDGTWAWEPLPSA